MGQVQQRPGQQVVQQQGKGGKPMKDPNAPKKPLSAYFLFSQEERLKVKEQFPDYSITEVAKELGRRWATIDPAVKQSYEQRYQESRRQYEQALQVCDLKISMHRKYLLIILILNRHTNLRKRKRIPTPPNNLSARISCLAKRND